MDHRVTWGNVAHVTNEEQELTALAERFARLVLQGMGARSRWALRTCLDAAETEGVAGTCVLRVPTRSKDYVDVNFLIGVADLVSRWGDTG